MSRATWFTAPFLDPLVHFVLIKPPRASDLVTGEASLLREPVQRGLRDAQVAL